MMKPCEDSFGGWPCQEPAAVLCDLCGCWACWSCFTKHDEANCTQRGVNETQIAWAEHLLRQAQADLDEMTRRVG